jgi:hypothetical protein
MFINSILYLDPGTGSIWLQVIIASITGAIFYLTLIRKRITAFFRRIFGKQTEKNEND